MDSTKIVGEKIKSLRETKEISVAELAVRSGLAEEQIERIENNVDLPSLAPLIKIARALGVRLGTFLDYQEEQGAVVSGRIIPVFKYSIHSSKGVTATLLNSFTRIRKYSG